MAKKGDDVKISELMTKEPLHVSMSTVLSEAIVLLAFSDVRHLPVVNEAGDLVGMLSERDALSVLSPDERTASEDRERTRVLSVADVMSPDVVTLGSNDDIQRLCDIFIDEKVGAVPIVDDGKLVGIASYIDVLKEARIRFAQ